MITLYNAPGTAGLVVHWLLIELGVPHDLRMLDLAANEHKTPTYLALNPAGVVPTLVIDDHPLCEAAAIVLHLADSYPAAALAPKPGTVERAAYYQWMFVCANTLQPAYRTWFYPDETAGEANADASKAVARQRIEAAWQRIDDHLAAHGPCMLSEGPTAVDYMITMLMRWSRNMPRPATTWPALARHATAMTSRPSFREVNAREGLTDWMC